MDVKSGLANTLVTTADNVFDVTQTTNCYTAVQQWCLVTPATVARTSRPRAQEGRDLAHRDELQCTPYAK